MVNTYLLHPNIKTFFRSTVSRELKTHLFKRMLRLNSCKVNATNWISIVLYVCMCPSLCLLCIMYVLCVLLFVLIINVHRHHIFFCTVTWLQRYNFVCQLIFILTKVASEIFSAFPANDNNDYYYYHHLAITHKHRPAAAAHLRLLRPRVQHPPSS